MRVRAIFRNNLEETDPEKKYTIIYWDGPDVPEGKLGTPLVKLLKTLPDESFSRCPFIFAEGYTEEQGMRYLRGCEILVKQLLCAQEMGKELVSMFCEAIHELTTEEEVPPATEVN